MNSALLASETREERAQEQRVGRLDQTPLSMAQVAQLSGISTADLRSLMDYGVLMPIKPETRPWTFDIDCVMTLQRADQLRVDLALDTHAFALAVMFLNQIMRLETQRDMGGPAPSATFSQCAR